MSRIPELAAPTAVAPSLDEGAAGADDGAVGAAAGLITRLEKTHG